MLLFNTLTRREEPFTPLRDNVVRMYSCGLTAYARGHIGNFRTFVAVDVLRRALKYQAGFNVRHVMNFTDVDDRTILESQKAGVPLREYTDRYVEAYREDAAALGLEVVEEGGRTLGRVADVAAYPANDVLELEDGRALPMVADCVREVDLEAGRVVVAQGFAE